MDKQLYTIGEVAKTTGVNIETIRYYGKKNLFHPSEISSNGYRMYSTRDIMTLQLIITLRFVGFSLKDIKRLLEKDLEIAEAINLQLKVVEGKISHLTKVQSILEQSRQSNWGERSLYYIQNIVEEINMSAEERKKFMMEHFEKAMVNDDVPLDWKGKMLEGYKEILPDVLSEEQQAAWVELKELLNDSDFILEMQKTSLPFWSMVQNKQLDSTAWEKDMENILNRAQGAALKNYEPDNDLVQVIVNDWISIFAKAMDKQVTPEFLKIFEKITQQMENKYSEKLWEITSILNPTKVDPRYKAQQLLLKGLKWKMTNYN